jgi:hypothetical protein
MSERPRLATAASQRLRFLIAAAIGIITVLYALTPLVRGEAELPTGLHHLLHAAMIAGAVIVGVLLYEPDRAHTDREQPFWLAFAVAAPIGAMFLMWPSEYAFLDRHPSGHAIEHLGLVVLGFVTAYAGERYARGIGWAMSLSLLFMAMVAALGFGVSPPPST